MSETFPEKIKQIFARERFKIGIDTEESEFPIEEPFIGKAKKDMLDVLEKEILDCCAEDQKEHEEEMNSVGEQIAGMNKEMPCNSEKRDCSPRRTGNVCVFLCEDYWNWKFRGYWEKAKTK